MRELIGQNFDGDVTLQFGVASTINLSHSALAEPRSDLVRAELFANLE